EYRLTVHSFIELISDITDDLFINADPEARRIGWSLSCQNADFKRDRRRRRNRLSRYQRRQRHRNDKD
ncbi:hypothetical protein Avbf_16783, partial [Armadillidium vulgare]